MRSSPFDRQLVVLGLKYSRLCYCQPTVKNLPYETRDIIQDKHIQIPQTPSELQRCLDMDWCIVVSEETYLGSFLLIRAKRRSSR